MSISILNTDANLSGKTLLKAEDSQTITGAKTFDLDPNPPFVVTSGSAVVPNLDADKVDGKEAAAFLLIDGTNALTAGISFPAVQVASSGVNVLDDYEEGSWTPVIGGSGGTSGQTYAAQVGRYIKIGKLVVAEFYAELTAKGTITTSVQIQGLPFTSENTTNLQRTSTPLYWQNTTSSFVNVFGFMGPNVTAVTLVGSAGAGGVAPTVLVTADLANNTAFIGQITYRATA